MPLQDGFGNDTRDIEYEEFLLDNERLLKLKTADRLRSSDVSRDIWDDVLQEGRIVQWEVLVKKAGEARDIKKFVSASMSMRISEVVHRETWTGMETHRGRPIDPLRRRDRDSTDDESLTFERAVSSGDWVDRVIMAYHHGEIMQAINALTFTQRAYVYARFWEGRTNAEIAAERGLSKGEVERQWRVNIRPRLVEELGHLAATV